MPRNQIIWVQKKEVVGFGNLKKHWWNEYNWWMCSQTDQEKKEKTNHQYERGDNTTDPIDIKRIGDYYNSIKSTV